MSRNVSEENFKKSLESVKTGNYDLSIHETDLLLDMYNGDLARLVFRAFEWGFIKGSRSEKAKQKKEKKAAEALLKA